MVLISNMEMSTKGMEGLKSEPASGWDYGKKKPLKNFVKVDLPSEFHEAMVQRTEQYCKKNSRRVSQSIFNSVVKNEILELIREEWGHLEGKR